MLLRNMINSQFCFLNFLGEKNTKRVEQFPKMGIEKLSFKATEFMIKIGSHINYIVINNEIKVEELRIMAQVFALQ